MSSIDSESENSTIKIASEPPLITPTRYSTNQVEILRTLGNYTFPVRIEAIDFLQMMRNLMKTPNMTEINRLPAPWRLNFDCFSRDNNYYI